MSFDHLYDEDPLVGHLNSVDTFLSRCNGLMGSQSPVDIFRRAHARLADPAQWTKGAPARDAKGRRVRVEDPTAVSWDLEGAVCIESNALGLMPPVLMIILDREAVNMKCINAITAGEALTHDGVLELLKRAIRRVQCSDGQGI